MYNEVDVIGKKAVITLIEKSKCCKFIIFRGGATKGSTPVFRCTDTSQVPKATRMFEDWADSFLRANPNNNLPYDMFLFSAKASELDIDETVEDENGKQKGTKTDKIRFTFSLNPYNNMGGMGGSGSLNIAEEIKKGIAEYHTAQELIQLREFKRKVDAGELDEEEGEEQEDTILKVTNFLKEIRLHDPKKSKSAAGDEDDDEDVIDEEEEQEEQKPSTKERDREERRNKRKEKLQNALKILSEGNPGLVDDLEKLAKFKQKQPMLFDTYMGNLRKMKF